MLQCVLASRPGRLHESARPVAARGYGRPCRSQHERTCYSIGMRTTPPPDPPYPEPARAGLVKQGRRPPRQQLMLDRYSSGRGKHNQSRLRNACRVSNLLVAEYRSATNLGLHEADHSGSFASRHPTASSTMRTCARSQWEAVAALCVPLTTAIRVACAGWVFDWLSGTAACGRFAKRENLVCGHEGSAE
jgi:hypothetical protein